MATDQELLDTARDYFHFVTKFFEVIKVSAPHIYHSALELSPESSMIRKRYHFKHSKPWVVVGTPNSWNQPVIIDNGYGSYTWSPCGQFFAAQTPTSVEVWDALTIEKCSDLQITALPGVSIYPPDALAYSPDGNYIAGGFVSVATIWDIQTGRVVGIIEYGAKRVSPELLAWSLDGSILCVIFPAETDTWTVVAYSITSGKEVYSPQFQSLVKPNLWPHNDSPDINNAI